MGINSVSGLLNALAGSSNIRSLSNSKQRSGTSFPLRSTPRKVKEIGGHPKRNGLTDSERLSNCRVVFQSLSVDAPFYRIHKHQVSIDFGHGMKSSHFDIECHMIRNIHTKLGRH